MARIRQLYPIGPAVPNPARYRPRRPAGFDPARIVLAKGSLLDPERRSLAEAICSAYPRAEILENTDVPHNRVDLGTRDPAALRRGGKQTLVLGVHQSPVRFSEERNNECPNYWHFSPYGFCGYDCSYCYLAGTPGVRFSPTVKVFVNLPEMVERIDRVATAARDRTSFYLGKLQDGLALDPLTGYSRVLVPYFASHPRGRLVVLTKSADVSNLLDLDHRGHTTLSWSLNPPEIRAAFESNTPPIHERVEAMRRCAEAGYPVRAVVMPIIPVDAWESLYDRFLGELLSSVRPARMTLGAICSYRSALQQTESELGPDNPISRALGHSPRPSADGRYRFPPSMRIELYRHLIAIIRRHQPEIPVGLCLEERAVFEAVACGVDIGRCNCVL